MAALYFVAILGEADHHGATGLIGEPKRSGYLQERSSFAPDYSSQQVVLLGLHCSSQSLSRYKRDPWLHLEKSDSIFEWSNIWVKGLYHGFVRKWETREAFIIVTGSLVRTHARWDSNPVSRKNIECIWNIVLDFAPVFIGGMTIAIFTIRSKKLYIAVTKIIWNSGSMIMFLLFTLNARWFIVTVNYRNPLQNTSSTTVSGRIFIPKSWVFVLSVKGAVRMGYLVTGRFINNTLIDCELRSRWFETINDSLWGHFNKLSTDFILMYNDDFWNKVYLKPCYNQTGEIQCCHNKKNF